jgi:hypothetical protein
MIAKCNIRINKCNKRSASIPKNSESFVWKNTNWKKIELRLNILQNKIYAAKRDENIQRYKMIPYSCAKRDSFS